MSALYLKDYLLPHGKIMGWFHGNYAGFPIFYHYFPLPFLLSSVLSFFIPLQISFKLVTALGTLLLPICVYGLFRLIRFKEPVPSLSAIFSLAFLFNEKNSMWGGNIPSTLAGEFSFSLSLSLLCLLLGFFYRAQTEGRYIVLSAILFSLTILSHGYTALLFISTLLFFILWKEKFLSSIKITLYVFSAGFGLIAFWFLPFLFNLPYTTPFEFRWGFSSILEIFPPILIPFFALSIYGFFLFRKEKKARFLIFLCLFSLLLYFFAPFLGLGDIRFLTLTQFFLTVSGAIIFQKKKWGENLVRLAILFAFVLIVFWVRLNTSYIDKWVKWNYQGLEASPAFFEYKAIFDYLKENNDGGRVAYEHSPIHERAGTMRIFELMKMFTGRDTLEGLYMQSSITSPYAFYIQAEISKEPSAPFSQYPVDGMNLKKASKHLSMFAVTHVVVVSEEVKRKMREMKDDYRLEKRIGDMEIYRVLPTVDRIVAPCHFEPNLFTGKDWKKAFYEWFRREETLHIPLLFGKDDGRIRLKAKDLDEIKEVPLCVDPYTIKVKVYPERIDFETTLIGHPHIVRVSYHPFWKVYGAKTIYLCAPSFILLIPETNQVSLVFEENIVHYAGWAFSFSSLILLLTYALRSMKIL